MNKESKNNKKIPLAHRPSDRTNCNMNEIGMLVGVTPNSPSNNKTRERSELRVPTSTATNKLTKTSSWQHKIINQRYEYRAERCWLSRHSMGGVCTEI